VVAGAAMRVLRDDSGPAEVRQLKNRVERLVAIVEGPPIHADDLPGEMKAGPRAGDLNLDVDVPFDINSVCLHARNR